MVHEVPNRKDLLAATTHPSAQGSSRRRNGTSKKRAPNLSRPRKGYSRRICNMRSRGSARCSIRQIAIRVFDRSGFGSSGRQSDERGVRRGDPSDSTAGDHELAKRLESPTGLLLHHKV